MTFTVELASTVGLALVVCVLALFFGLRSARLRSLLADRPNERSLHTRVTPRFGGLAIGLGVLFGLLPGLTGLGPDRQGQFGGLLLTWITLYLALAACSVLDDRRPLSPGIRLVIQLVAATAWTLEFLPSLSPALQAGGETAAWSPLLLVTIVLLILGLVWSMNLYNFMDGADGLAGSMAVFGFGCYGAAAVAGLPSLEPGLQVGAGFVALAAWAIAAAAAGFLIFNFPPARVFMGDAGSIPLGFSAAALGMMGAASGLWSPLWPLIVFFPFVFDASLTLLRRLARGEAIWRPHREHLYQRVVLQGRSHRAMTLRAIGLMVVCAAAALAIHSSDLPRNFAIRVETLIIALQFVAGLLIARRIGR